MCKINLAQEFISHHHIHFMHIAVTGNIGAGKTTLASKLADHFGWEVLFEAVEGNPYLAEFYSDMPRWAFHLQMYFLKSRYEQVMQIQRSNRRIIQDRTIYEDAFIFAMNLYKTGIMSENDYATYRGIFDLMMQTVKAPDLTIYLKADLPKLVRQIEKRGRDFEANISHQYLADLNNHYEEFVNGYTEGKLLVIDVNDLDYVNNTEHFEQVIKEVDKALLYQK